MSMWPDSTDSKDLPPPSWVKLLDHVHNNTMYQEALQSASNIALLIREPVYRRAFAWARAEVPTLVSAPSPQTLRRLRANTMLKKAAEDGVALTVTSRELCDVDPELRDKVVRSNEMPINLPKNWDQLHVVSNILCHCCPKITPFADRMSVVVSVDLARFYCSSTCCDMDAVEYASEAAANVLTAASIVKKWRARRSWPFTVTGVHDGTKLRSLPLDIRVVLAMSSPLERTNLAIGMDAAELSFIDSYWPVAQEIDHTVLYEDQARRKHAEDAEIMSTKTHGAMKRAREARAFPDWFNFPAGVTRKRQHLDVGNSLPPLVMALMIGKRPPPPPPPRLGERGACPDTSDTESDPDSSQ